jgi:bla regulator protein BlaR1
MKQLLFICFLTFYTFLCKGQQELNYSLINLDSIFQENQGTFVLFDCQKNDYRIYNYERSKNDFAVHSTCKIFWSIVGLEENIISDENRIVKWDSIKYPQKDWWKNSWAKDQSIVTALNNSVNWYYFELLSSIAPEITEKYLIQLNYKPDYKVERVHYFGFSNTVRKSALEQIDFIKGIYQNDYKISDKTIETIKQGLLWEQCDEYTLYGKTGLGPIDNDKQIGWYIGMIEKGENKFIFALNIENESQDIASKLSIDYSLKILKTLGLI